MKRTRRIGRDGAPRRPGEIAARCPYLIGIIALFCSCELARYNAPPVINSTSATSRDVDLATLQRGRRLYAQRCIECHVLPPVWRYSANEWPRLVDSMAQRAALKPPERDAIVAYIRAARGE